MANCDQLAQTLPLGPGVRLLAVHPAGLVALEKPEGVLSHPNTQPDQAQSLIRASYDEAKRLFSWRDSVNGAARCCTLLHRLDSATSGLVLVAIDAQIAQWVLKAWELGKVKKIYAALVKGRPRAIPTVWVDSLEKSRSGQGRLRVVAGGRAQAKTTFKWIRSDNNRLGLSLLELNPLTGRTHQLRVQCALHGCPIVGDRTYGDFDFNRRMAQATGFKRLALHAQRLELELPSGERFSVQSALPEAFDTLLNTNATYMAGAQKARVRP
ncbi:MAG: hypothetical protein B7X06_00250 [Verrucomicrobia bacterium 21-51-4]|nr:MAG: hypothetical protein B7X06_00250 [Verrucomicrobia bacterium 21-51-4]HQU08414.1 RluA family pseudouridine synthase [Opitutales bacterium]